MVVLAMAETAQAARVIKQSLLFKQGQAKMNFLIKQLSHAKDLPLPSYQTEGAAGMDLYACVENPQTLKPMERAIIPCGFKMALPIGFEAQIRPRSGLALKHGLSMPNSPGTIDADYRGELGVLLINLGNEDITISRGDRIAQMIINKVERVQFTQTDTLPESPRGEGGFGSTGTSDNLITKIGNSPEICVTADKLKQKVFIEEQGVPKDEVFDGLNESAVHVVILDGSNPVSTARIIKEGEAWRIGLVAVDKLMRGKRLGEKVMQAAIDYITAQAGNEIVLTAQQEVCKFYEKLGFEQHGEVIVFESGFVLVPMKYRIRQ
jgi:dUTP pyrophosphatase